METKQEIRKRILKLRKALSKEEKERLDMALCAQCLEYMEKDGWDASRGNSFIDEQDKSFSVYLYLDIRGEAGTRRILEALWERKISTALPRVEGDRIHFYTVTGYADVAPGCMGILEPLRQCRRAEDKNALVLVPGVAFDAEGLRLGYGGGYYDRFFSQEPKHPRWGLAYGFQLVEKLPAEKWDQRVDRVVTPEG